MSLISYYIKGDERWTVALSLAANRASKVEALRESGNGYLADKYRALLDRDVSDFLAQHTDHAPGFDERLRKAAQMETPSGDAT